MLGIEDYGSDSDSGSRPNSPKPSAKQPASSTSQAKATKPQRAPKKFTIALPTVLSSQNDDRDNESPDHDRPSKKRKTGAGVSSLLSMLPTPKEKNPVSQPERVLGGGTGPGLNFRSAPKPSVNDSSSFLETTYGDDEMPLTQQPQESDSVVPEVTTVPLSSTLFRPTHVAKGKKNISLEESNANQPNRTSSQVTPKPPSVPAAPAADFFSFSSLKPTSNVPASSTSTGNSSTISAFSAAPSVPTFEPPEPQPTDPYPGYYQLPSGEWAAHDPVYFAKFMKKWEKEYNDHVRALEKGDIKGFEGLQNADVEEIDALKEMEKAKKEIQEREAKKAITADAGGGPVAPKMNINASKTSGVARSRHQLSTLLKEAYENREALEERIAQGKRNRKEAGNKYGF
ncbi:hypothetical protein D9619_005623 [Psilocybe cf. subviscida]|uniref:Mitotic checkpoint regulator, MAD2B-interacting-domain-containing protein n=1 Tax=Psilocybe cf. subviscida TaxID=2480587 RepID=A0A8H5FB62_9AGAR|nr:hypothetical protein D9619_005623 [Psilocybe cf. subviscida]